MTVLEYSAKSESLKHSASEKKYIAATAPHDAFL